MNTIFYQTNTQFENTGDVLINRTLIDFLREYGKVKCNCSTKIPEEFLKELDIREEEKLICKGSMHYAWLVLKSSFQRKKGDCIYLVSGLGHQWGGNRKVYCKNVISGILFAIFKAMGVRIIKIGFSIGPVTKQLAATERFRSNFISHYYVRDQKSYELCKEIGINKAMICPDMSWLYERKLVKEFNNGNEVCVCLRESILNETNPQYISAMFRKIEEVLEIAGRKIGDDMKVFFFYQVKRDSAFAKQAYEHFKDKYDCVFIKEQVTIDTASTHYARFRYVISNRLHSLLLGYKYGTMPIAVIDSQNHIKISQTFIDNGLEDYLIDVYAENREKIERLVERDNDYYGKLLLAEKKNVELIQETLNSIFQQ